jgi:hypothetical protein
VKGLVQRCLNGASWAAGPVVVLAGLGAHVAALVVFGTLVIALAVLACLMWRWTLGTAARSDRGIRMVKALRGDQEFRPQCPPAQSPSGRVAPRRRQQRVRNRVSWTRASTD